MERRCTGIKRMWNSGSEFKWFTDICNIRRTNNRVCRFTNSINITTTRTDRTITYRTITDVFTFTKSNRRDRRQTCMRWTRWIRSSDWRGNIYALEVRTNPYFSSSNGLTITPPDGQVVLRDKLKTLKLYHQNIYGHETWQDGDLPLLHFTHIIAWFCEVTWQTKNISQLPQYLWAQNLAEWCFLEWILPIKSYHYVITWPCKVMWQTKVIICPLTQSFTNINFRKVDIHNEPFPSIKSQDPLIAWFCKVT